VRAGLRPFVWPLIIVGVAIAAYALLRHKRTSLVDFEVYRTAATRALAAEPLYRPEDGHYQYKYLPAFALAVAPVAWLSKDVDEPLWFAISVGLLVVFTRLSLQTLPDRRLSTAWLVGLAVLVTGKFWVKELAFGQTNLWLGILLVGAVISAQHDRRITAGALIGLAVFVKPYALVFLPWLAWAQGLTALLVFSGVLVAGLVFPAAAYGWSGNLHLIADWYRTVTDTTMPNLLLPENISLATMWAKWIGPGRAASTLAAVTASALLAVAAGVAVKRRTVREPNYLEAGLFLLLVPLLSPQGWDYVLLLAMPAYMCLLDRWRDMTMAWRATTALGILLTGLTIFDLLGRALYTHLMEISGVSVGALILIVCLAQLRWRALA
jgi:hypothetical protein